MKGASLSFCLPLPPRGDNEESRVRVGSDSLGRAAGRTRTARGTTHGRRKEGDRASARTIRRNKSKSRVPSLARKGRERRVSASFVTEIRDVRSASSPSPSPSSRTEHSITSGEQCDFARGRYRRERYGVRVPRAENALMPMASACARPSSEDEQSLRCRKEEGRLASPAPRRKWSAKA